LKKYRNVFKKSGVILQQDNDPVHLSKITRSFFEKNKINILKWPSQSPDINIIENVWHVLKEDSNKLFRQRIN
jgi:hypothetical protein